MGLKSYIWIRGPAVFTHEKLPCHVGLKRKIAHQKTEPYGGNRRRKRRRDVSEVKNVFN